MKICKKCGEPKELEEYFFKNKRLGVRQDKCRDCFRVYRKEYYEKNKIKAIAYSRETTRKIRDRNREFIYKYLLENSCADCGESNPVILEFDHIRDKSIEVSNMIEGGYSILNIQKEIEKCEVRCCNCHRLKTARDFNYWAHRKHAGLI